MPTVGGDGSAKTERRVDTRSSVPGARPGRDRGLRGDLFAAAVAGERFDAIVSNPPWVPASHGSPARSRARARGRMPEVTAREADPLGPLMRARRAYLEAERLLRPGQPDEVVVVVRAQVPVRTLPPRLRG